MTQRRLTAEDRTVAVLFADPRGVYSKMPGVDLWDEKRDARKYAGPYPVVAHPPCARWCQMAPLVEHRYGIKRGEDGGCFASALESVRRWGGILEHPAYTRAFPTYGIPSPVGGGWQRTICGGWVCEVSQCNFGHRARKATWLYAYGVELLPSLDWSRGESSVWMTWLKLDGRGKTMRPPSVERMGKRERNATPVGFAELLLSIARSVKAVAA